MIKIILLILLFLCCVAFGGLAGYHIAKKKIQSVVFDIMMCSINLLVFTLLFILII